LTDAGHDGDNHDAERGLETWQVIVRDTNERLPISRRQWPIIKALVR
jgi:two-component system response regulator AlgR